MSAATGKYNLYMDGTAENYLLGRLSVGGTTANVAKVVIGGSATGGTSAYGAYNNQVIGSDVTASFVGYTSVPGTSATSFTLGSINHFLATQGTFGAGSTVSNQYGYVASASLTGATNNYGFYGAIPSAAGRWNLYMVGTAPNYLAGVTGIGVTASSSVALTLPASTVSVASLRLPHGTAPTAPVNGDIWTTTGGLMARINGATLSFADASSAQSLANKTFTASAFNGTIGATTPGTGAFTTLSTTSTIAASGSVTSGGNFVSTSVDPYFRASVDNKHIVLSGGSGWTTTGAVMVLRGATDASNAHGLEMYTGGSERLRITSGGNVGIGTITPAQKLEVEGSIRAGGRTRIEMARPLTGAQGDTVAIGSFSNDAVGKNIRIYLKGHNGSVIDVQTYEINEIAYLGATTNWLEVPLNQNSVSYGGISAYALDIFRPNINWTGDALYLRVRVKRPIGGGSVQLVADFDDDSTFTPSTAAGSVSTVFNASTSPAGGAVDGYYGALEWMFPVSIGTGWGSANGEGLYVRNSGNVGIGTINPTHKLAVNGTIRAKEIIVDTGWADYVFEESYRLAPLSEVEAHIKSAKHLPGVPSAAEVAEHGVSMGQMQATLLSKIEELTLHLIEQNKLLGVQAGRLDRLEADNQRLRSELVAR